MNLPRPAWAKRLLLFFALPVFTLPALASAREHWLGWNDGINYRYFDLQQGGLLWGARAWGEVDKSVSENWRSPDAFPEYQSPISSRFETVAKTASGLLEFGWISKPFDRFQYALVLAPGYSYTRQREWRERFPAWGAPIFLPFSDETVNQALLQLTLEPMFRLHPRVLLSTRFGMNYSYALKESYMQELDADYVGPSTGRREEHQHSLELQGLPGDFSLTSLTLHIRL